jgi:hypothetical protein
MQGLKPAVIRTRLLVNFRFNMSIKHYNIIQEDMAAAEVPTLKQIQNFVGRLKPPSKPLMDADLIEYANRNLAVPENVNKPFVTRFMPYQDEHFVIVWTTTKLIQVQNESKILATDATYKLNW